MNKSICLRDRYYIIKPKELSEEELFKLYDRILSYKLRSINKIIYNKKNV